MTAMILLLQVKTNVVITCFWYIFVLLYFLYCTDTCPSASVGTDFVLNGHYYSKLQSPSSKNYEQAMENCRDQGGILPIIQTEQDYNDAKVIAGTVIVSLTFNKRNSTNFISF